MLTIREELVDDMRILHLSGRLTIDEPCLLLREKITEIIRSERRKVILDLGDVSYIDGRGQGELVSAYVTLRNRQGDVKLLNLSAKSKDLLQMTKLLTVFDIFDDRAKAIASFRKQPTKV